MSLPFVRIENGEALEAKRSLLNSELNMLNLLKRLNSYKKMRKLELGKKIALKRTIRHNIASINSLMRDIPSVEGDIGLEVTIKEKKIDSRQRKTIESELKEIRSKLGRLNQ
jgi:hypothetical protein